MKRTLTTLLAVLLVTPLFATATVFGQTSPTTTTNTQQKIDDGGIDMNKDTQQKIDDGGIDTETETAEQTSAREARIKQLKEAQKVRLATAEKNKLKEKCQAAQGKMSSVSKLKGIETSRTQVHENILNRLNTAVTKLKEKGVDTTTLETEIAALKTKIEKFNTDLATYKQSVSDLRALDCKTDPEGFKAALTTARANLETVRADAKAVHAYLKDTLRPLLTSLKKSLGESTTTNTENNLEATDGQGGTQ